MSINRSYSTQKTTGHQCLFKLLSQLRWMKLRSQRMPAYRLIPRYLHRKRMFLVSTWFHYLLGLDLPEGGTLHCLQFKANSLDLLTADPQCHQFLPPQEHSDAMTLTSLNSVYNNYLRWALSTHSIPFLGTTTHLFSPYTSILFPSLWLSALTPESPEWRISPGHNPLLSKLSIFHWKPSEIFLLFCQNCAGGNEMYN